MTKPVLIFLHGGPGFLDYLRPFFHELNDQVTTVFYDQLQGPDVKVTDLLKQLDEIVDSHTGKKILVGHSWGGVLGALYAIRNQNKLAGLVLMNTGLNHIHWYDEFRVEKNRLGLMDAPPHEIFLTADEREAGMALLDSTWQTFSGETFDSLEESYLRTFDLTASFGTLNIPLLNIFGEKDVRFPARVAKALRNYNHRLIDCEISGAGHFSFLQEVGKRKIYESLIQFVSPVS